MAAGSLVIRISADINDFSKKLSAMTRDVNKAADTIGGIGKKMTLGITLPAAAAGLALAKMALENQETARKMARVFGDATESMQTRLDGFAKMVPVAGTELQQMAIGLAELGDELGATGSQAADFADAVLDISVKLAAAKGVPLAESVEAVGNAMKGQLKGLKALGVVIDDTQLKQTALQQGLMRSGQELNGYGTMLATVALLQQKSNKWTNEAATRQDDLATQLRMATTALGEFADATSSVLLPVLKPMIGAFKDFTDWLNSTTVATRTTVIAVIAFAAAIGPLLVVIATLVKLVTAVGAALAIISAPVWVAIATGIGLVTAAVILLNKAFKDTQDFGTPLQLTTVAPYAQAAKKLKPKGPTTVAQKGETVKGFFDAGLDYTQIGNMASNLSAAFDQAVEAGRPLTQIMGELNRLNLAATHLYDKQANKLSEIAIEAQRVAQETSRRMAYENAATGGNSYGGANTQAAVRGIVAQSADGGRNYARQDVGNRVMAEAALQFREFVMKLPDTFDAAREAAVSFAESLRGASEDLAMSFQSTKQQYSSLGNIGSAAMGAVKESAAGLIKEFSIWQLILKIISEILSGIGPQIGAIFGLFKVMGQQLGLVLAPVFKLLYNVIRYVIIAFTWLSRIIVQFTASLLTGVGKLLTGLGNAVNKLPGSFGNPLKKAGEALTEYGRSQYKLAGNLKKTQEGLQSTSWEDALNGVDALGDAAASAAEQLLNLPDAFKYKLRKFQATDATEVSGPSFGGLGGGGDSVTVAGANGAQTIHLAVNLDGKVIANSTLRVLTGAAQAQLGDSSRFPELRTVR